MTVLCAGRFVLAADGGGLDVDQVLLHPGAWGRFHNDGGDSFPVRKDLGELMRYENDGTWSNNCCCWFLYIDTIAFGGAKIVQPVFVP